MIRSLTITALVVFLCSLPLSAQTTFPGFLTTPITSGCNGLICPGGGLLLVRFLLDSQVTYLLGSSGAFGLDRRPFAFHVQGDLGDLPVLDQFGQPTTGVAVHNATTFDTGCSFPFDTTRVQLDFLHTYRTTGPRAITFKVVLCSGDPANPNAGPGVPTGTTLVSDQTTIITVIRLGFGDGGQPGDALMVDPVPDLLNGPRVVAADDAVRQGVGRDSLAILGRPVQGVSADGVTQTLVRITAANPGDQFTVAVLDDHQQPSGSSSNYGALGIPGASSLDINQSQISVTAVSTTGGPFAFAVYRAPTDFARSSGSDDTAGSRKAFIQVSGSSTSSLIDVTVVRPPVALIHGIWSSWDECWTKFAPLVTGRGTVDPRFSVLRVSYDQPIGPQITQSDPVYFIDRLREARANSLGYAYNAPAVLSQMSTWLQGFRMGGNGNPTGIPVAAAQLDVVAHSMGGDITRRLALLPTYLSNSNFGQGFVHKAITISTPHKGTPVAPFLLDAANGCTRRWLASKGGLFAFRAVTLAGAPVTGGWGI